MFLPLAAVLLGILIMALQKPIVMQSFYPILMPQSFSGEYSYDGMDWHPLDPDQNLSARNKDLYLRGHFENSIPEKSQLNYFSDHIGSEIYVNGELVYIDSMLELAAYGIPLQPSMCCREWKFIYFEEGVPTDAFVEIHLKNPHAFGNKNAYEDLLSTLCGTANEKEHLAKNLVSASQPYNAIGMILAIAGILLLCSALVSLILRFPIGSTVVQTGLLAASVGGCFLLDTIDLCFKSDNHIFNTYGWQICILYSVYLLGIMTRDILTGKRRRMAGYIMALSVASNVAMILVAFTGKVLMYDTLPVWVMLQWVCCPVLVFCCGAELFAGDKKKTIDLWVFMLIFICILLDTLGILGTIYSRNPITKSAIILVFLLKVVQFSRTMIFSFSASNRARTLEKELEESRIALMLSQIQPHFIFNVLGTIRGLCREDPEQAWHGLGDFSTYLRGNMNALANEKSIPFEMELAHVETYLRLEQMRLGKKLNVIYDIQKKDFSIPPLTLQPLVENAVKHGIFYKAEGGTVTIQSRQEGNRIILSVLDDGVGFEAAAREGDFDQRAHHGLTNVRSRVEKMLGGSMQIDSHPEQGSAVTLEFPIDDHS